MPRWSLVDTSKVYHVYESGQHQIIHLEMVDSYIFVWSSGYEPIYIII